MEIAYKRGIISTTAALRRRVAYWRENQQASSLNERRSWHVLRWHLEEGALCRLIKHGDVPQALA